MYQEVANKWTAALRSGKYTQCGSKLCGPISENDFGGHCCLGVLCDLAIEEGVPVAKTTDKYGRITFDGEALHLPSSVKDWAGMSSSSGAYGETVEGRTPSLADLNDDGVSFTLIARVIEEHVEIL